MRDDIIDAAHFMLCALDKFMSGAELTDAENEAQKVASMAGCFAATAYELENSAGPDVHALTRSFLIALIDPTDPDLDYLRANPSSGAVAREAADHLHRIAKP